jgi:hypothetical protein
VDLFRPFLDGALEALELLDFAFKFYYKDGNGESAGYNREKSCNGAGIIAMLGKFGIYSKLLWVMFNS